MKWGRNAILPQKADETLINKIAPWIWVVIVLGAFLWWFLS